MVKCPKVQITCDAGDAIVFDYRVLHRGRANTTHLNSTGTASGTASGSGSGSGAPAPVAIGAAKGGAAAKAGRNRPLLCMVFTRKWFVDGYNYPPHSIHR